MPFRGYDLSFGTSLVKVGRDGCQVFISEGKASNAIYFVLIYLLLGPLHPDGFNISVLLAFSYAYEKQAVFPVLK